MTAQRAVDLLITVGLLYGACALATWIVVLTEPRPRWSEGPPETMSGFPLVVRLLMGALWPFTWLIGFLMWWRRQ